MNKHKLLCPEGKGRDSIDEILCIPEKCPWWNTTLEDCSVKVLARALSKMAGTKTPAGKPKKDMLCPKGRANTSLRDVQCVPARCPWWVEESQNCSIPVIADMFFTLSL